jgi:hypothetical protein
MIGHSRIFIALATAGLAGCGLSVPSIQEPWDSEVRAPDGAIISATAQIEFEIKKRIYCDLREAVIAVQRVPVTDPKGKVLQKGQIPAKWGASVAIMLVVDESVALSPGVSFNEVMPNAINKFGSATPVTTAQSFSLGFGATLSSTASRTDKFNPYYTVADLSIPFPKNSSCLPGNDPFRKLGLTPASSSPFILESDLGIKDWLSGATFVNNLIQSDQGASAAGSGPKVDTISYEIKFVIVSNGNVTPTWKLVKFAANTSTPLFSTGRTRTHDLIITIGPDSDATKYAHLASQIASGVGSANRALISGQ